VVLRRLLSNPVGAANTWVAMVPPELQGLGSVG
jgi:hypothetical protein